VPARGGGACIWRSRARRRPCTSDELPGRNGRVLHLAIPGCSGGVSKGRGLRGRPIRAPSTWRRDTGQCPHGRLVRDGNPCTEDISRRLDLRARCCPDAPRCKQPATVRMGIPCTRTVSGGGKCSSVNRRVAWLVRGVLRAGRPLPVLDVHVTTLVCIITPDPCDDKDACTKDSCSPETGCVHAPIPGCGG